MLAKTAAVFPLKQVKIDSDIFHIVHTLDLLYHVLNFMFCNAM